MRRGASTLASCIGRESRRRKMNPLRKRVSARDAIWAIGTRARRWSRYRSRCQVGVSDNRRRDESRRGTHECVRHKTSGHRLLWQTTKTDRLPHGLRRNIVQNAAEAACTVGPASMICGAGLAAAFAEVHDPVIQSRLHDSRPRRVGGPEGAPRPATSPTRK